MKNLTLLLTLSVMALSCKKNQPIPFVDDFECTPCPSSYCVPIEQGDTNTIEVELTELTENLITNGTFASGTGWTVGGSASIGAGVAVLPSAGALISRNTDSTLTSGYYKIVFDIAAGDISSSTLHVSLGGEPNNVIQGVFIAQTITIFQYLTSPASSLLSFTMIGGNWSIDNVAVYKMSSVQYTIQDCATEEVFYTNDDNEGIIYFADADIDIEADLQYPTLGQTGFATVTLNWATIDLPDGCYCICFKDSGLLGYEFIENGGFASSANWTIVNTGATGWSITAGVARHSNIAPPGNDVISQTLVTPLLLDNCFGLAFTVIAAGAWEISVSYDTALLTNVPLQDFSGSGTTPLSAVFENIAATVIHFTANTYQFDIDFVSLQAEPSCILCELSNCISLRENWDTFATTRKMCNILVSGTNANKAFGFSAGYAFTGRVFGVIRNASYPDVDNTEYKNFAGLKSLQYNDNEKVQELQIAEVPQGVHDWLRLALRSQTLTLEIAGETKTFIKKAGDYAPNWRKTSPSAPVIVEIQEVQQVPSNARNV